MKRTTLCGTWTMTGGGFCCTGTIPGSVYAFLLDAGLMEDPYYRDNEDKALALMEHSYTFSRTFDYRPGSHRVLLCCDGLDTLCTIFLNGTVIASTKNMHRRYEFDVTQSLRCGENHISIRCDSPTAYVRQMHAADPINAARFAYQGYYHLRKANCSFGWDWAPRLPDAGIWREIFLLEEDGPRITDVSVRQRHDDGCVFLTVTAETSVPCALSAKLTAPDGSVTPLPVGEETEVHEPRFWWPNGLGDQPLYTVSVCAEAPGLPADTAEKRIGLRELKLIREQDRWGGSMCHEVNGVRYFAMGANCIPQDLIFSRITDERLIWLLRQAKDCNFNTLRIWGGGYYPDDRFLDACDELGIVIFLDVMFACCMIPDREEMRQEVAQEVRDNLLRIRHHACLGMIAGNNEMESRHASGSYPVTPERWRGYSEVFEETIPAMVEELCPGLGYIPSSPTTCGHCVDPQNENYGDSHYWAVWHKNLPYSEYRKHFFRYLSEFGFQSFPSEKTLASFTLPEERNVFSRIMERHQRRSTDNGKILSYLSQNFLYPSDPGCLLYASQLMQARAMACCVEHLRRNRGRCMGALYWQFNDVWPGVSWSGIDYFGRYKALQYYAKRFFRPVMLSCEEVGETTTRENVNIQHDLCDYATTAVLAVHNDSVHPVEGIVRWTLCAADSTVLEAGTQSVAVPPMSVRTLDKLDFLKTDVERNHLFFTLETDGTVISRGSVLFTAPKHYLFADPRLTCEICGDTITVHAQAYAADVEIWSPDSDFILSDNFFDMEKGSRTVKILEGTAEQIRLRSVFDIR